MRGIKIKTGRNFPRFGEKRFSLEELPLTTMKFTLHALRWIFLLIFLLVTIGVFVLFIAGGENYLQIILGYSIAGFFTFFMGYFGWMLATSIKELISRKQNVSNEKGLSYYIGRKNKFRY
ncbi:MAG: hypothetical protein JXA91_04620 [Candidatus Thermoplasmatota archaeon]|nr:hypothetical protein [Candidatus Thermoplasmatota archaeon]